MDSLTYSNYWTTFINIGYGDIKIADECAGDREDAVGVVDGEVFEPEEALVDQFGELVLQTHHVTQGDEPGE